MKNCILTGEIKLMEPNEKGGLSIRVRNVHGDGKGSNLEFFDIYNNYAETLREKNVIAVGDIVSISYEEKRVQKIDPETGKPSDWVTFKDGIRITRTYRPDASGNQPQKNNFAVNAEDTDGFDKDAW